jgi:4'-phosphopantetheinyl transferase EntD
MIFQTVDISFIFESGTVYLSVSLTSSEVSRKYQRLSLLGQELVLVWRELLPEDVSKSSNLLTEEIQELQSFPTGSPKRFEFAASRQLIRNISKINEPLLTDPSGKISWPSSVYGSLSHSQGNYAWALSSEKRVGLDLEKLSRFHEKIERRICNPSEQENISHWTEKLKCSKSELLGIIFSLKEAAYKALVDSHQKDTGWKSLQIEKLDLAPSGPSKTRIRHLKHPSLEIEASFQILLSPEGENYVLSLATTKV